MDNKEKISFIENIQNKMNDYFESLKSSLSSVEATAIPNSVDEIVKEEELSSEKEEGK